MTYMVLSRVVAKLCHCDILSVPARYDNRCLNMSVACINLFVWRAFAETVNFYETVI